MNKIIIVKENNEYSYININVESSFQLNFVDETRSI